MLYHQLVEFKLVNYFQNNPRFFFFPPFPQFFLSQFALHFWWSSWMNLASGWPVFLFQLQVFESEELNQSCKWATCTFVPIMCFCAVVEHEGVECRYQVSSLGICCNYVFLCCWTWNWMYIASGWPAHFFKLRYVFLCPWTWRSWVNVASDDPVSDC